MLATRLPFRASCKIATCFCKYIVFYTIFNRIVVMYGHGQHLTVTKPTFCARDDHSIEWRHSVLLVNMLWCYLSFSTICPRHIITLKNESSADLMETNYYYSSIITVVFYTVLIHNQPAILIKHFKYTINVFIVDRFPSAFTMPSSVQSE